MPPLFEEVISIDQKIELMKLATKIGEPLGDISAKIDVVISNYKKMIKAINAPTP